MQPILNTRNELDTQRDSNADQLMTYEDKVAQISSLITSTMTRIAREDRDENLETQSLANMVQDEQSDRLLTLQAHITDMQLKMRPLHLLIASE